MTEPSEGTSCPLAPTPAHPAALVIDYAPVRPRAEPDPRTDAPSPYETLAYLAYVLPARICAANPDLYKEHFR